MNSVAIKESAGMQKILHASYSNETPDGLENVAVLSSISIGMTG